MHRPRKRAPPQPGQSVPQVSSSMLANREAGESSAAMTFGMMVQIMSRSKLKLENTRKASVSRLSEGGRHQREPGMPAPIRKSTSDEAYRTSAKTI